MLKQLGAALVALVILVTISYGSKDNIVHDLNFNKQFESKKKIEGVDMDGKYNKADIEQEKNPSGGGGTEPKAAKKVPVYLMPNKILCLGEVMGTPGKDGPDFKCIGKSVNKSPPKNLYCSKSHYAQIDNETLCLVDKTTKNLKFSKDVKSRKYKCQGGSIPPVIMKITDFKDFCKKQPWEMTHCYYPKPEKSVTVKLPDPDLPCLKAKCENCYLKGEKVKDAETMLYLI